MRALLPGVAFLLLLAPFFSLLASCSDDLDGESAYSGRYELTRGYSDEQILSQRLGYAYNAAGNVMDDSSFSRKPVIDMERLMAAEETYGLIVNSERRHYTSLDIFSGNTLQEMGHEETKYTIDEGEEIGGGKYYRNSTSVYKDTFKNCYKAHMFIKHVMATRTIDAGILRCLKLDELDNAESVLEADFRQEVAALVKLGKDGITEQAATRFSEKYGTHLVVSSNLGGMIELQMEINRDSCVDKVYTTQQVITEIMGEQVVNTNPSKVLREVSTHTVEYRGQIQVKGGTSEDCALLHRTFDETQTKEVRIADGDYYGWATHLSIEPESYNAVFIGGRFLPLYDLFEEAETRIVMRRVYELYMKQEAPSQEVYEPPYGVLPVKGNYGPDVRVVSLGEHKACIICEEYVPSIRSDKPCVVAYPLIRGNDNRVRPFFYTGLFVGDESHRPGRVIWEGSASVYTPSDSIFFESDNAAVRNLFDPQTRALKDIYLYWNAVHPQPCPTKKEEPQAYTSAVYRVQPDALAEPTAFAKVASTFWSVRPVVPKADKLYDFWEKDSSFQQFYAHRYNDHQGILMTRPDDSGYYYCLLDGGDLIKRVDDRVKDFDGDLQWMDAVSQSMNATGLGGIDNSYLPSVEQSKSITKMLGNRMNIFYSHEYDGRNMLGLDWPTGYWVLSHPAQTIAVVPTQVDGQGMPIITNDAGQARIMRLSGSGTDLLLEYPEYVRSFNYSDQAFFKYFPIYITIETF